jgi:hypothetical protein
MVAHVPKPLILNGFSQSLPGGPGSKCLLGAANGKYCILNVKCQRPNSKKSDRFDVKKPAYYPLYMMMNNQEF